MSTKEQPVTAVRGEGKTQEKREFTPTQWEAMGDDKAGWKAAKPTEALLTGQPAGGAGADAELLDARQRYAALFDKQPAANASIKTLNEKIDAELARQNAGGTSTPAPSTNHVPTGTGTGEASTSAASTSKAAADASKGLDSQTEQK